ncbi:AAA family ATPase [Desulfobacterales bacterium HSG17]|nr:AAA family ATPase [Desulfobacterales bacterium HSG17]
MKFKKIELCNFRAVNKLSINLSKQLNVFVGVNGAGKSTIIDAIAITLSWLVNRIQRDNASGRPIPEISIRNAQTGGSITANINESDTNYCWVIAKNVKGKNSEHKSRLGDTSKLAAAIRDKAPQTGLPVFAYYPVNRNVLDIPLRIRQKHTFELFECFDEALTGAANFRHFFEWFRNREDLENENRKYVDDIFKPENFEFPDPQLEAVRKALESFLPEFKRFSVGRNPLRMIAFKNKEELRIEQLSDGEKSLIALIGDLARRLAIANPESKKPLEGKGIILIDEIDLHLHPQWQRMIVPKLTQVFPGCQFIISTHSPQILSHVKPENIFLLKNEKQGITYSQPSESYGKNSDRILEDLMMVDARPSEEKKMLHELFEIIQKGSLDNARKKVQELKQLIGEDPELVKADVLIKRREIIGK